VKAPGKKGRKKKVGGFLSKTAALIRRGARKRSGGGFGRLGRTKRDELKKDARK